MVEKKVNTNKKVNIDAETRIILKGVRLSYVNIISPKEQENEDGTKVLKYSVQILVPKEGKHAANNEKLLDTAIKAAKEKGKAKLVNKNGVIPTSIKICKRDGDTDETYAGGKIYINNWVVNASNQKKPGLVDVNLQPIMSEEEIYSGIWAYVSINVSAYATDKAKGIAAYINNVMKLKDGDRLDGAISAEKEFSEIEIDEEDLEDLETEDNTTL